MEDSKLEILKEIAMAVWKAFGLTLVAGSGGSARRSLPRCGEGAQQAPRGA